MPLDLRNEDDLKDYLELGEDGIYERDLPRVRVNDPNVTKLSSPGCMWESIANMTVEDWEQLGNDILNNTHLKELSLSLLSLDADVNNHKFSSFFRGLTRSNSIEEINLRKHFNGVRSMVPFLQNACSLKRLNISENNISSEGFNTLFRALSDSPIEQLNCNNCGIETIEIDGDRIPLNLRKLYLGNDGLFGRARNSIDADGCRGLVKLLQGDDATLETLDLGGNNIDDECIGIFANVLTTNKSLKNLVLADHGGVRGGERLTLEGLKPLLKAIHDVSSIKATLQSNHTLQHIFMNACGRDNEFKQIHNQISDAINGNHFNQGNPNAAGRSKIILSQLNSQTRSMMCRWQGIDQCHAALYSQIDPLHLPEVLAFTHGAHGFEELYVALKISIAALFSTMNKKEFIKQQIESYEYEKNQIDREIYFLRAELAAEEEAEIEYYRSSKRPRI